MSDVYVYGMTVLSTIHRLGGAFPARDGYQEIKSSFVMPGGEGANCAVVLRHLGVSVTLDGCLLGDETAQPLKQYLEARGIDCSKMSREEGFAGWRDVVYCDGESRTVFGWFGANLFGQRRLWTEPCEASICSARCVALDPFFGDESERAASLCCTHETPYVTIDSPYDGAIAQGAAAVICSREFLEREYPTRSADELFKAYREACGGLVVFTFGTDSIVYASRGDGQAKELRPFRVEAADTLAAGDTFRAGVVYGMLQGWADVQTVRFAAGCAAVACTRFPSVHEPPSLDEVMQLVEGSG